MNYQTIRLDKTMYKGAGGFSGMLEQLDPGKQYTGTELSGLDAFQRQLKRFDIKVSGPASSSIAKFFQTPDAAYLFPEYVSRAVAQGAAETSILEEIIASRTDSASPDYRSIITDLQDKDYSAPIGEGEQIPETSIALSSNLVRLTKRGRLLKASYEAIKFQRIDVFTVALRQIGAYIAKAQLKDAVRVLINGDGSSPAAKVLTCAAPGKVSYSDLLRLWGEFSDFELNTVVASPDMMLKILSVEELLNPLSGINFQNTGCPAGIFGARLMKSTALPEGTAIGMDKRFALEMVTAGGISVEYDKLIDTQLERAAITSLCGFSKIFPEAVRVLQAQD